MAIMAGTGLVECLMPRQVSASASRLGARRPREAMAAIWTGASLCPRCCAVQRPLPSYSGFRKQPSRPSDQSWSRHPWLVRRSTSRLVHGIPDGAGGVVGIPPGTATRLRAEWKQEIEWKTAPVVGTKEVAEEHFSLVLQASKVPGLLPGYTKAGQYVQVRVGDSKPAFLAIACSPEEAHRRGELEFLIKDLPNTTASKLCTLQEGASVEVSPVMGKGFPLHQIPPSDITTVLLFATGSGISPIRALIESGLDLPSRNDVRLYYGCRYPARMPYHDRFTAWKDAGVTVVPVLSLPPETWTGDEGYVQHAFQKGPGISDPSKTGAVLCGQRAMTEEVISILTTRGVQRDKIIMNF